MRDKLLAKNVFIENEYFEEYLALFENASILPSATYSELHHLIPVSFYKQTYKIDTRKHRHAAERCADADPDNTKVLLSYADHCKAHWLLSKCMVEPLNKYNETAFLRMINVITKDLQIVKKAYVISNGLTQEDYDRLQEYVDEVKFNGSWCWTVKEDQWLIENFRNFSVEDCAKHLQRTETAVRNRASQLKLKHIGWTPEMDDQLIDLYITQNKKADECANFFKMSKANIVKRCRELNLKKAKQWTAEEDEFILQNDSKMTVPELAKVLGVSKTTLMGRRWTLGITKFDRQNR